jgi:hypothetical protein
MVALRPVPLQQVGRGAVVDEVRRELDSVPEVLHPAGAVEPGGGVHQHDVALRPEDLAGEYALDDARVVLGCATDDVVLGGPLHAEVLGGYPVRLGPASADLAD